MRYLVLGGLGLLAAIVAACGGDDASSTPPPDDGDAAATYTGSAKAGVAMPPDASGDLQIAIEAGDPYTAPPCCKITFAVADGNASEATAVLRGDLAPVDDAGIPLTYAAGKWSATACIPEGSFLRYRFYFGDVPEVPGGSTTTPDYRTDPSQPTVPDGAGGVFNTFGPVAACSDVDAAVGP